MATSKDYLHVMCMYGEGVAELGDKFDDKCALTHVILSMKKVPCFLLCDGGTICGMIGLQLIRNSHNSDARLSEYMVYIYPKYRSLKNLNLLVEQCKKFASAVKLPMTFHQITGASVRAKARLARMNGFKVRGLLCDYE